MNHKINLLTVILAGLFQMSIHAAGTNVVEKTRELVASAVMRAAGVGCRTVDSLSDNYAGLRSKPEFLALRAQLDNSWETALSNMDVIAKTDMAKAVLLYSFEGLSERDYVAFLRRAADFVERGELNRDIFYTIQSPLNENSQAWAVLVRAYKDPDVKDVIMRSKKIFADQSGRAVRYDLMLSGESFKKLKNFEPSRHDSKDADTYQGKRVVDKQKHEEGGSFRASEESVLGNESKERKNRTRAFTPLAAVMFVALVGLGIFALAMNLKKK